MKYNDIGNELRCPACHHYMADCYNKTVAHVCEFCGNIVFELEDKIVSVEPDDGGKITYNELGGCSKNKLLFG